MDFKTYAEAEELVTAAANLLAEIGLESAVPSDTPSGQDPAT